MTTIPKSKKKSTKYTLGTDAESPISKSNIQDGIGGYQISEVTYGTVDSDIIEFIDSHLYSSYMSDSDGFHAFSAPPIQNDRPPKKPSHRTTQEIASELELKHKNKRPTLDTCSSVSEKQQAARSKAIAARRREYESKRAILLLALLDSGIPYTCCECKTTENITIDHKHPLSKGGSDELDNLRFLCGSCNSRKGSKTQA